MKLESILLNAIYPALDILPMKMRSDRAQALLIAIGLQESRFEHRFQVGGPAHGYWQFERGGGVAGVLKHAATSGYVKTLLDSLDYDVLSDANHCYNAIAHNDILAAGFARLLIWSSPTLLPSPIQTQEAWNYYIDCWRPGKPHLHTWGDNWKQAWEFLQGVKP